MKGIFGTGRRYDLMKIAFFMIMLLLIFIVLLAANGLSEYKAKYDAAYLGNLKTAISDSLITCYSLEGRYPESLEYLADHYGLILNKEKYIFGYELVGSNLFQDFEVVPYNDDDTAQRTTVYGKEGGS
jgi:hypothetical protein